MSAQIFSGHVVVMGVAGCGKSSLGRRCARACGLSFLEGDDFHPAANVAKMRGGTPLTDQDRAAWLDTLAVQLKGHPQGAVLTCSALRRSYREQLRAAAPGLRFLFLNLTESQAKERVAARSAHLFPVGLVASQFEALEDPSAEEGVLCLDAMRPLEALEAQAVQWLEDGERALGGVKP
jgi:gluconokinase